MARHLGSTRRAGVIGSVVALGYLALALTLLPDYGPTWDCAAGECPYGERVLEAPLSPQIEVSQALSGPSRSRAEPYGIAPPPFSVPGLPGAGLTIENIVPPQLTGVTLRLQCLASTPHAGNGLFAATNAVDIVF